MLATAAKVSVAHYSALFRRQTGFAPIDFLIRLRAQHACRLLDATRLSVGEVAEQAGYADPYYFTRCFPPGDGLHAPGLPQVDQRLSNNPGAPGNASR